MRRRFLVLLLLMAWLAPAHAGAQTRTTTRKPAPPPAKKVAPAEVDCPSPLGSGVGTRRVFCDVPIGRTSADGITITIPPHRGATVLTFDLHNRITYSEDLVRARRSYARLTATVGVMTMDNTLVTRAVVQSEFRTAADLFDRIGGGAGPGGLKAVAPTGAEPIRVELPADLTQVWVLGEKLAARRPDADEMFTGPGRPIALISNVMVEFVPAPAAKTPVKKPPAKAPAKKTPAKK
ncbi:MAG TPA: hypothetical protein VLN08_04910 [Vicinamibacterales bacterium]|nr:hypothetical protein [Vicinamibacterales bacterium]